MRSFRDGDIADFMNALELTLFTHVQVDIVFLDKKSANFALRRKLGMIYEKIKENNDVLRFLPSFHNRNLPGVLIQRIEGTVMGHDAVMITRMRLAKEAGQ